MESGTESEIRGRPNKPEFDGGNFTIEYFSNSPHGFEVKTRHSLLRHSPTTPLPEAKKIKTERDREPREFRIGPGFTPKVGLRNIQRQNNELVFDIQPVTFPTFRAISSSGEPEASLAISNPAATAAVLLTTEADGSHKLLVQHRSERNFFYGGIPGASIAGYLDGELDKSRQNRGKLVLISTPDVIGNIQKEMIEEIGVKSEEIKEFRITGLAKDKIRIHDEFLLLGVANLTSSEIAKREGIGDIHDAGEKFFIIEGTSEAIEALLTQVKCPLPHTHVAAFVAAGYSMVLERDGLEAANKWKVKLEEGVRRNYSEIDQMVAKYYQEHPEVLKQQQEGKPPRNPNGYEPAYLPQEQGLPDVVSELKRVGLISQAMDNITSLQKNPEMEKQVNHAWLFDVDGVITNPEQKRITEPRIINQIIKRLESGEPVALVTGRSVDFMRQRVIDPLRQRVTDLSLLQNFLAMGEKGGVWITYNQDGKPQEHVDENISVPQDLQDNVRELIKREFSDLMFYDESKKTMISTEMIDGTNLEDYHERQKQLNEKLEKLVEKHGLKESLEIDPTTIATDIQNKHVGKDFAARRVLTWLKEKNIKPAQFIAVGDSRSDIPMAQEIHNQGLPVSFVFVGSQADRKHIESQNLPFPVTFTKNNYEKGTLEYLNSISLHANRKTRFV